MTHRTARVRSVLVTVPFLFALAGCMPSWTTPGQWSGLRSCESGGNYATNTGNGFFGAYQFDQRTWNGVADPVWVGRRPSSAPPSVQDDAAHELYRERGREPWPVCGYRNLPDNPFVPGTA